IVNSRRVDEIVKERTKELQDALDLAANVQRSMLPPRISITETDFYTTGWYPKEVVSGDLFEVMPLEGGGNLYVLGDIQGHGVSAALSMMAVQSFLKHLPSNENITLSSPAHIANLLQAFFANNLGAYSYMTALICKHQPREGIVDWLSCGAPDLNVIDPENDSHIEVNPEKRGGLPIGIMPDTVYTDADVVRTHLTESALCIAFTDGLLDVYKDKGGYIQMSDAMREELHRELLAEASQKGSIIAVPYKFLAACEAYEYSTITDDMTELIFGAMRKRDDFWEKSLFINSDEIERMALEIEQWCNGQGWSLELVTKVQLVFEEKMMNLHDHGYDIRDRSREQACVRLKKENNVVELTFWECGTPEPSIEVAAGSLEVALELKNREFSGRGRGRLMVREICSGVKRNRFGLLNETIYYIPMNGTPETGAEE
ncbi:MAG: SpoIIE family protein phosphatase, partial [Victivallales bacterium]|nr:SpoIIE family protein phosphatase [Victivallales bacterium]